MIIIAERIILAIDTTEGERKVAALDNKIEDSKEKLIDLAEDVVTQTQKSYNEVMGMMRASYMMITGVSQAIGGTLSQVFSSMFSIALSAIGTYQSIATAMAATGPAGWIQAGIMATSLIVAGINLATLAEGQTELSRRITGLNMSLHSISSMIGMYYA